MPYTDDLTPPVQSPLMQELADIFVESSLAVKLSRETDGLHRWVEATFPWETYTRFPGESIAFPDEAPALMV